MSATPPPARPATAPAGVGASATLTDAGAAGAAELADVGAIGAGVAPGELAALGARLRAAGLTERALAAWVGTARLAAVPAALEAAPPSIATPAAALLALLVAGADVPHDLLRRGPGLGTGAPGATALDALLGLGFVEQRGALLRARVAIAPLGRGLLVCDRLDAAPSRELVCWPDDSSHHLAAALPPGRRASWLDLGCGSAFAPLARPELAAQIVGVDLNPRAVRCAALGAALSGVAHLAAVLGDAAAPSEPAALVTCNAPIPDSDRAPPSRVGLEPELWRRADPGLFERLWPALRRAAAPGGLIVVHAALDAIAAALATADGERVVVRYTPDGVRGFAVAWWRPDAPARWVVTHRALTAARPHLDARDRDEAAGA